MSVRPTDGGGLLGTPLPPIPRGPVSLRSSTPADLVAPSPQLYDILHARKRCQPPDTPDLDPSHPSLLYTSSHHPKSRTKFLDDLMDDEDRVHHRLSVRRRARASLALSHAVDDVFVPIPFAVAAAEEPELVPVRGAHSLGHVILRESGSWRPEVKRRSQLKERGVSQDARYRLDQFMAFASKGKKDVTGLGFEERRSTMDERGHVRLVKRRDGVRVVEEGAGSDNVGSLDEEHDYANAAYKDLHSAAERVQLRLLRQRRRASEKARELRKRALHISGLEESQSMLFKKFEHTETLFRTDDICFFQEVPASFRSKPVHDFECDRYRKQRDVLPHGLRQESEMLACRQQRLFQREERLVKAAIAKSEEKREERLRKMRERFAVDMRANFVSSSGRKSEVQSSTRLTAATGDSSKPAEDVAKVGASNRTITEWHPSTLLCKRFAVQIPNSTAAVKESSEVKNGLFSKLSDSDDDSDFHIHAIIGADGRRIDFHSSELALVSDKDVILTAAERPKTLDEKEIDVNPSKELYAAIFKST